MDGCNSSLNAQVLMLNRNWLATCVTSSRRAFSLLWKNLAEIVHVDDGSYSGHTFDSWTELSAARDRFDPDRYDWIRTVKLQLAVPKVIRVFGYDRLPTQNVKLNRRNIFARDRNRCQYCGQHFPTLELSLDHLIPRSRGGKSTWENLVCSCTQCNIRKGGRTPDQADMHPIYQPVKPRRNPTVQLRLGSNKYAS